MHGGLIFHTGSWREFLCLRKQAVLLRSVRLQLYLGTSISAIYYVALVDIKTCWCCPLVSLQSPETAGILKSSFQANKRHIKANWRQRFSAVISPVFCQQGVLRVCLVWLLGELQSSFIEAVCPIHLFS